MQLSLRTLLAFEDNIFDIEQHRQLEQTIPNHEPAAQILARIRNIIHNPTIDVPGKNGQQQEELDPNIVAEYLDYQMTKEYQEQFENFCLSADKYLAEVASIHQVISNVLGEPARISRECRFRCYDLFQKFQHLNNRYENDNQFITFPQFHAAIPAAQIIPQIIPTPQNQHTTNNYYENINQENTKNIIPLPQKNETDNKPESEKNKNESLRKSLRDAASIVAVIIVIVLLFLLYRNDNNFDNIKINTAATTEKNNTKTPEQQTQNNPPEIIPTQTTKQPQNQITNENEQNKIRTVSATTNEFTTEKFTPADKNKIEKSKESDLFIETKIARQPPLATNQTPSAQPLPLPISVTNNISGNPPPCTTTNDPFTADPFTSLPSSPVTLHKSKSVSASSAAAEPLPQTVPPLSDSIFNAAATTPSLPAPPVNTPPNETQNPQPLPQSNQNPARKNINETEIQFREEKQPESQPLASSVWKTRIPHSETTPDKTAIAADKFNANNFRNDNSLILPAGGIDNITGTRIVQVNNNDLYKNATSPVENQKRISVTKKHGVLGNVVVSGDPMVIFTADSSESQWRFKSNQFDIYANQYILTSAPFRADIKLGEDFTIEMIGDSKLSVLSSANGVAAIYIDYGRLVIRACYDKSTALKQVKLIRISTEQGECTVGFNGSKSVMFVDTFAEISRSSAQSVTNTAGNSSVAEIQIGTNPILGLLPDPSESISWLSAKQNVPSVVKSDMSIVLTAGRSERGIIRNHPNWLRRISVPAEGKQIETACLNIFNKENINIESALQMLLQEKSETIRSFGYRLWGDLGRFDVPLKGRIFETESIQLSLVQYFKEVMKRDGESIQRLTDAIEKERTKNN
ncbi:MAG: hypothetical protein LBT09_13235 [Planctomycetaceae bacterium]|jgi:hypothetical protein|nr:hypothetical protein [Planctomycetaceae bacterium]